MSKTVEIFALLSTPSPAAAACGRPGLALRLAGYGLMLTFVSCGVGARDFTAGSQAAPHVATAERTAPSTTLPHP
ncbi:MULTISPECIES: hypothetical protein [unclassified Pseudomonas]|uniref:hypothetical protein n=1 Tax=unclassified Pseudomonas TaxID=196821 RepID=UPI000A1EFE44|nr:MULTISPECIES: hypothetical protein [unclassified Pseudomonas]